MRQKHNTHNVIVRNRDSHKHMSQDGEQVAECGFCDEQEGLSLTAIMDKESNSDEELDPKKVLWLCEEHLNKLFKSEEYRLRELPNDDFELSHSSREEIEERGDDFVVMLKTENENKWLKAPKDLETDLNDLR